MPDDSPALVDDDVVLLALLVAFLELIEHSLDETVEQEHHVFAKYSSVELDEVLLEVEVEKNGHLRVALYQDAHDRVNVRSQSRQQVLVIYDCVQGISTLKGNNFFILHKWDASKEEVDGLQESLLLSAEKHICIVAKEQAHSWSEQDWALRQDLINVCSQRVIENRD